MIRKALLIVCCAAFIIGAVSTVSSYVQTNAVMLPGRGIWSVGWGRGALIVCRYRQPTTRSEAVWLTEMVDELYGEGWAWPQVIKLPAVLPATAGLAFVGAVLLARPLLRTRRRHRRGQCLTCGYDVTGNTSGKCPECGTKIARPG